jgi:hypothetical protein
LSPVSGLFIGTILSPLLLPFIPFRSFAIKGALLGAILLAPLFYLINQAFCGSMPLTTAVYFFLRRSHPIARSILPVARRLPICPGVKKEMRFAVPSYLAACGVSAILLIVFKLQEWGIL